MTKQQVSKYNLIVTLKDGKIIEDNVLNWIGQYNAKRLKRYMSYGNPDTPAKIIEYIYTNKCLSGISLDEVESLSCYLTKKLKTKND